MPGVYVHSVSSVSNEESKQASILNVPGSYWFCHKSTIYKITFKFHKSIRNTTDFCHSRELVKIARKIMQWPPREGQQYRTANLFVTYNQSTWTRPDKICAAMKYYEKPDAVAFPYAFLLTVKIEKRHIESGIPHLRRSSVSSDVVDLSLEHLFDNESDDKDISIMSVTTGKRGSKSFDKFGNENSWSPSSTSLHQTDKFKREDKQVLTQIFDESSSSSNNISDCHLPYQYMIERELKKNRENLKIEDNVASCSAEKKIFTDFDCEEREIKPSRKKFRQREDSRDSKDSKDSTDKSDIINLRSSNITDLVMKGLMFTIRQDEDTVTVMEQKTKLEVDEVLENSEKVETKEGDPCLINSSLLRLEKMITRFQEPRINADTDKPLIAWNDFEDFKDSEIMETEEIQSNIFESEDENSLELKMDDTDEEDEDIVPEALYSKNFLEDLNECQDLLMDDDLPQINDGMDNAFTSLQDISTVVSNKTVANSDIPLSTLEVVKNKSTLHSNTSKQETNNGNEDLNSLVVSNNNADEKIDFKILNKLDDETDMNKKTLVKNKEESKLKNDMLSNHTLVSKENVNVELCEENDFSLNVQETSSCKLLSKCWEPDLVLPNSLNNNNKNNSNCFKMRRRNKKNSNCIDSFYGSVDESDKKEVKVKLWKLITDITRGVHVVIERMDIKNLKK